ncbi:MAG: tetratricopeptide repeat protein [Alphaproteobacteria bacterium]
MRAFARSALAVAMLAMAAGPAMAAGSSSSSDSSSSSGSSSAAAADPNWAEAKNAIAAKDYDRAMPLLQQVVAKDPSNADAFNYLGYTHGRAGKHDEAIGYYQKALALMPEHRGANEYLGELYLKLGDVAKAKERLAVLDSACFFGCTEFDMLKKAVADYETSGTYTSRKGL